MVDKIVDSVTRWWPAIAAVIGFAVMWGVSQAQLVSLSEGQRMGHAELAMVFGKLDVMSHELAEAKMAAVIAKDRAEHAQMQMDEMTRNFNSLQRSLVYTTPLNRERGPN
jgi:hypothetical protein